MNRAVVVLLLLIANAIVTWHKTQPAKPAGQDRIDHSLGLFTVVDGMSLPRSHDDTLPCLRGQAVRTLPEFDDIRL
jgi:hypothetical protein